MMKMLMRISPRVLTAPVLAAVLVLLPSRMEGQGVSLQVGRLFDDGGWTAYNLAWTRPLIGPLGAQMGGLFIRGPGVSDRLFGATLDATLFRGGLAGVYAVGGIGAGFGTGGAETWWRSWSAGVGYELIPIPFLSLGVEGRYREMLPSRRSGAEIAIRIGTTFGATAAPPVPPVTAPSGGAPGTGPAGSAPTPGSAVPRANASSLLRDVVRIAEEELGTRYQYGGVGGGSGFDCSGLIQYAYGERGIVLPRRSVDQARAGREIGRREDDLLPGDILTFSSTGGTITHVGLYMGDDRFVHSASKGVQISRLGTEDPNGRWWYQRWIGARRVVEP